MTMKMKNDNERKINENEKVDRSGVTKQFDTIVLKATGRAIYSAVTTAEVVKRKVANLHQMTKLETLEMVDVWEPLEEGLKEVKTTRRVASICITLSRDPSKVDTNAVGYQEPIPAESVGGSTRGRGRGRGRGYGYGYDGYGYGRGRGRGRGYSRGYSDMDNRRPYRTENPGMRGRRQDFSNDRERGSYSNRRGGYGGYGGRGYGRRQDDDFVGGSRPRGNYQGRGQGQGRGMGDNRQFSNRR